MLPLADLSRELHESAVPGSKVKGRLPRSQFSVLQILTKHKLDVLSGFKAAMTNIY